MRRVAIALTMLAVPGPAYAVAAPAPAPASVGTAIYYESAGEIWVPFTGVAPTATAFSLSPTRHYVELTPARLASPGVQHHPLEGPLKRFTMAARSGSTVRLSLETASASSPWMKLEADRGFWLIRPFGAKVVPAESVRVPRAMFLPPVKPGAKGPTRQVFPTPKPVPLTAFTRPEAGLGGIVMPFTGLLPDYRLRVNMINPKWLYFEFESAEIAIEGKHFGVIEDPVIEAWMVTKPKPDTARLYLRLKQAVPIGAEVLEGQIRVAPAGPLPSPSAPPALEPEQRPSPLPTSGPSLVPEPVPGPAITVPATPVPPQVPTLASPRPEPAP